MQQLAHPGDGEHLLDFKIIIGIGTVNCCCHVATGAIWDYVRVPQVDPHAPTSYFGGYLALIGLAEMLLFAYLLLFYSCGRTDAGHLRKLRLVACILVAAISVAVLVMLLVKSYEYISKSDAQEDYSQLQSWQTQLTFSSLSSRFPLMSFWQFFITNSSSAKIVSKQFGRVLRPNG